MCGVLPAAIDIGLGPASRVGCYFVFGRGIGSDSVTKDTKERSCASAEDDEVVVVVVVATGW